MFGATSSCCHGLVPSHAAILKLQLKFAALWTAIVTVGERQLPSGLDRFAISFPNAPIRHLDHASGSAFQARKGVGSKVRNRDFLAMRTIDRPCAIGAEIVHPASERQCGLISASGANHFCRTTHISAQSFIAGRLHRALILIANRHLAACPDTNHLIVPLQRHSPLKLERSMQSVCVLWFPTLVDNRTQILRLILQTGIACPRDALLLVVIKWVGPLTRATFAFAGLTIHLSHPILDEGPVDY